MSKSQHERNTRRYSTANAAAAGQDKNNNDPNVFGSTVKRSESPLWKGFDPSYNYEDFATNVKKKGITKDDLTLESHKSVCELIVKTSKASTDEIARSFGKVKAQFEEIRGVIETKTETAKESTEETSLKLLCEKVRFQNCIIIQNCPEKDKAKSCVGIHN